MLRQIKQLSARCQGAIYIAGLGAVAAYNWRQWQRDRALAERLRRERSSAPELACAPKVSVLVAAWNEHTMIDAHIRSFLELSYPNIELILCAGGADDTLERARRYAGERVIVLEQRPAEGKQRALARCLAHASGEIIYLTDADCVYTDAALMHLLATLAEGEQAATGGSRPLDAQLGKLLPRYLWASDVVAGARQPSHSAGLLGRNAALTRRALDRIGGLDFPAATGTDYQLARRLIGQGIAIRYVDASVVPSEYPETLGIYRRKRSRWLRNLLIYGWREAAWQDVRVTLQTVATGALMVLAPLAAGIFGRRVLALWSLLFAHAAGSRLRYALFAARLAQRPVPARLLVALVPLTLIDFAIWALPIVDLLDRRRREQW